jgi:hypothetical protein
MNKMSKLEAILWSIALPGFGQLLNGKIPGKSNYHYINIMF